MAMETNGYSLTDIATAANGMGGGFAGGNSWWLIILFLIIFGGNGFGWNRNGDFGQYATAASQQEILFGQQFQNLDNKLDRLGNGIADATFALNNSVKDGNSAVAGRVVDEGRALSEKLAECCCTTNRNIDSVKFDMANYVAQAEKAIHAEGEATRALIQQNKIDALQGQINQLQLQNAMCGVVRYPNATTYNAGPSCYCGSGCGGNI